ncbi:hypothetical protein KCU98_g8950, partial [Aureobasidium melanogenum]
METPPHSPGNKTEVDIIDIRSSTHDISLKKELETSLSATPPKFPSLLLWDEKGLQHFEAITYSPEYYLTNCEIELLKQHSNEIARQIAPGSIVLELGSGCLRKIKILLDALEAQHKPVDYYALDLSRSELERTLLDISPSSFQYVKCHGLLGTYDDGLRWLQLESHATRPKCILSLGSTIGSSSGSEAADFLGSFVQAVKDSEQKTIFVRDLVARGVDLKKGQGLHVVSSHKFDEEEQEKLWEGAGLQLQSCWKTEPHKYALNVLSIDDIRNGISHAA